VQAAISSTEAAERYARSRATDVWVIRLSSARKCGVVSEKSEVLFTSMRYLPQNSP
jgi:hypothetical protein